MEYILEWKVLSSIYIYIYIRLRRVDKRGHGTSCTCYGTVVAISRGHGAGAWLTIEGCTP